MTSNPTQNIDEMYQKHRQWAIRETNPFCVLYRTDPFSFFFILLLSHSQDPFLGWYHISFKLCHKLSYLRNWINSWETWHQRRSFFARKLCQKVQQAWQKKRISSPLASQISLLPIRKYKILAEKTQVSNFLHTNIATSQTENLHSMFFLLSKCGFPHLSMMPH